MKIKITLLMLIVSMSGAIAQTTSERLIDLQQTLRQQKSLNDRQVQELLQLQERLKQLDQQQQDTLQQLDQISTSVAGLTNQLNEVTQQVKKAERELEQTNADFQIKQAQVDLLRRNVSLLLNSIYRERSSQYLSLLSQSKSLSDLMIRLDYHNKSGKKNIEAIQQLNQAMQELSHQQEKQKNQTLILSDLQNQSKKTLQQLNERRREQQQLLAGLQRTKQGQQAIALQKQAQQALTVQSMDRLVSEVIKERERIEQERRRRLEEEHARRIAEAKRLAEEAKRLEQEAERQRILEQRNAEQRQRAQRLRQQQDAVKNRQAALNRENKEASLQRAPLRQTTSLLLPIANGRVTQPFGQDGMQWTVLSGSSVGRASLDGYVIAATYYASLGWVVLLDHGNGVVTGYFGLRDTRVRVGERVARGGTLGAVGGSPIFGNDKMAFQYRQGNQVVAPVFR